MPVNFGEILASMGDLAAAAVKPDEDKDGNELLLNALRRLKPAMVAAIEAEKTNDAKKARQRLKTDITFDKVAALQDFFQNVAGALIEAQKKLDESSIQYSKEAALMKAPPARFAIPQVQAELRFGFSSLSSKGLNLIVFSNQKQREEHSENSVKFDLVATPLQPKEDKLPSGGLIHVDGLRREAVLDKFLAKVKEEARLHLGEPKARELALVLEYRGKDSPEFLVLWPGKTPGRESNVETWSVFTAAAMKGDSVDAGIFETKGILEDGILVIPPVKDLKAWDAARLQGLAIDLGDALMNVCMIASGRERSETV